MVDQWSRVKEKFPIINYIASYRAMIMNMSELSLAEPAADTPSTLNS